MLNGKVLHIICTIVLWPYAENVFRETLHILGKYNPENFNIQEFESDLRAIFLNSAHSVT
jgi:hypothetical protein